MPLTTDLRDLETAINALATDERISAIMTSVESSARSGDFVQAFRHVDEISEYLDGDLVERAGSLMESEDYANLSNQLKARVVRQGTSRLAEVGHELTARAANIVLQEQNKALGVARAARAVTMDGQRLKDAIGKSITEALEGDYSKAAGTLRGSYSALIKQGAHDAMLAAETGEFITEFSIQLGAYDGCDYCRSRAGYWSEDQELADGFHSHCRCILISRRVPRR